MEYAGIALVPLIIGINEVLKITGLSTKYIPLVNLILGVIMGIFVFNQDIKLGIVNGIFLGLSAAGLYSSGKHIIKNFIINNENEDKKNDEK